MSAGSLRSLLVEAEKKDAQLRVDLHDSQKEKEQVLASGDAHLHELGLELQQLREKIDQIEAGNAQKAKAIQSEVDALITQVAGLEKRKKALLAELS